MRRCRKPMAFLSILASFALSFSAAQAAQDAPPPPSLYLMADIQVDVFRAQEYETALKDLIAVLASNGFPITFDTYATDDSRYYVIYGLDNYGSVDGLHQAWREAASRIGPEKFRTLQARITAAESSRVLKFWTFRPDISFLPVPERLKPGEFAYYTWDFVSVIPGKEAEFEALNREWIALSAAKKTRDPFMTYRGGIGTDEPVYVWFEYGKSAADYALAEERFWKAVGPEGAALSKRTRALIQRQETKTGRYRPDLSYAPKR
ncbi:MAG: hypothetical protein MUQ25_06150 [Candidatus Aminicenantes bacterium]|nr:hypothetical protein [Candidatus Aminicenantes bacterium]